MKPENLSSTIHIKHLYLMFVSREMDIKLCQIYTKIHLCNFVSCRFKQIIFSKYETNLKKTSSCRNLRISGLLLLYSFNFYFAFLIDIIDNIITFNPYCPYYVTRTSANGSAVYLSRDFRLYHVKAILYCHWLKLLWRNTDDTDYM